MRRWRTSSEEETRQLGLTLGSQLMPNGILLLSGELGVGKTVLAQGVAAAVGVPEKEVQSPSFILVREHDGSAGRFIHIDLYRLSGPVEVFGNGTSLFTFDYGEQRGDGTPTISREDAQAQIVASTLQHLDALAQRIAR